MTQQELEQKTFDDYIATIRREERLNVLMEVAAHVSRLEKINGVDQCGKSNILSMIANLGKKKTQ